MRFQAAAATQLPRQGPRPLPLHLATASLAWMSSLAALPSLRSGSLAWRPELAANGSLLAAELAAANPEALAAAVAREAERRFDHLPRSIRRYRRHPFRRAGADGPCPLAGGQHAAARLPSAGRSRAGAAAVLVVPSLINRAYILDLLPERSFMTLPGCARASGRFSSIGSRPGRPSGASISAITSLGRLARALDAVVGACGERPVLHRLLHGRRSGPRPCPSPRRRSRRPGAAGHALGFPCRAARAGRAAGRPPAGLRAAAAIPWASCRSMLHPGPLRGPGSQPGAAQIPGLRRPRPGLASGRASSSPSRIG